MLRSQPGLQEARRSACRSGARAQGPLLDVPRSMRKSSETRQKHRDRQRLQKHRGNGGQHKPGALVVAISDVGRPAGFGLRDAPGDRSHRPAACSAACSVSMRPGTGLPMWIGARLYRPMASRTAAQSLTENRALIARAPRWACSGPSGNWPAAGLPRTARRVMRGSSVWTSGAHRSRICTSPFRAGEKDHVDSWVQITPEAGTAQGCKRLTVLSGRRLSTLPAAASQPRTLRHGSRIRIDRKPIRSQN